jgi:hypothetical protein
MKKCKTEQKMYRILSKNAKNAKNAKMQKCKNAKY